MNKTTIAILMACGVLSVQAQAQATNENSVRTAAGLTPIYRVTVTERTSQAISYRNRSGATKIDFRGTSLMPKAHGEAKVESKQGYIEVEVEFRELPDARQFGPEYLTYVLWAVTPEGRTSNMGEILRNGTSGKLDVTTELQVFGLIVTAEPYFAVSRPSNVIVMENKVRPDTLGKIEMVDSKYELLEKGEYSRLANMKAEKADSKIPLEVYEARNAIQIARASGADIYATDTFAKAEATLKQTEDYRLRKAGAKPTTMTARQAVQVAEDSRAIAVKRQDEQILAEERQNSADRESRAEAGRSAALSEADRVTRQAADAKLSAQKEADQVQRENASKLAAAATEANRIQRNSEAQAANAQNNADRLKRENDNKLAAAQAETDRARRDNAVQIASANNEVNRLKAENDAKLAATQNEAARLAQESAAKTAAAQAETARIKQESDAKTLAANNEADRLRRENEGQRASAQAAIERIASEKKQLENERAALRVLLLQQFNAILQTRDTARGLIVNMSDVTFATGKYALLPGAQLKLAKVAGIVSGHPGLRLDVEGHTDNVGNDATNQRLSEERGASVRDFLIKQGMTVNSVSSKGLGESAPVATNDTAAGRQQNRRVELVISGEIIGQAIAIPVAVR